MVLISILIRLYQRFASIYLQEVYYANFLPTTWFVVQGRLSANGETCQKKSLAMLHWMHLCYYTSKDEISKTFTQNVLYTKHL